MFPDSVLSSRTLDGAFEYLETHPGRLYDYEYSGVALNDGTQGLEVQYWVCWANRQGEIRVKPVTEPGNGTLLITAVGVTRLSFSFDRNMQPAVAYELGGAVYFYWFNSVTGAYTTTVYAGGRTPRVCHDDRRASAADRSDVVLVYLKEDQLVYRVQRDRYLTEHILRSGLPRTMKLVNLGMNRRFRVQIEAR